jgi:hypothetical protein
VEIDGEKHIASGPSRGEPSQALFRQVNERIRGFADGYLEDAGLDLVCECENGCLEHLSITLEEYEYVRRFPTRFVMKPGHHSSVSERVVQRSANYVIVEKLGLGAIQAVRLDPRRARAGRPLQ